MKRSLIQYGFCGSVKAIQYGVNMTLEIAKHNNYTCFGLDVKLDS